MVGIYHYSNGLKFMDKVAKDEASAWEYLDKTYGRVRDGVCYPCNHNAFEVCEIEVVDNEAEG